MRTAAHPAHCRRLTYLLFMPPVFSMALPLLWLVRVLALAALTGSWWLTIQKWMGPRISLAGCGGSEGCATLLDSRWSQWFFIPVSLMAATLWLAVLLLTLPSANRRLGRTADQLLAACAVLLVTGAVWFGFLMLIVVKVWCPWCAALHLAGLVAGGTLLYSTWQASRTGERGLFAAAGQAGIAGAALLVLGQIFGQIPDTHLLTSAPPDALAAVVPVPTGNSVVYLDGTLAFPRWDVPSIGARNAPHVLAGFSDYTCTACRAQHSDLKALLRKNPESYAVLILPVPLERACNPHLPANAQDHANACDLARLSLAFWKAAPDQFAAFHDFLMSAPLPLAPATALTEAHRLAATATPDPTTEEVAAEIVRNIGAWHRLSTGNSKLPKLLLRDTIVLHGSTSSRERFFEIIAETFAEPAPANRPFSKQP